MNTLFNIIKYNLLVLNAAVVCLCCYSRAANNTYFFMITVLNLPVGVLIKNIR